MVRPSVNQDDQPRLFRCARERWARVRSERASPTTRRATFPPSHAAHVRSPTLQTPEQGGSHGQRQRPAPQHLAPPQTSESQRAKGAPAASLCQLHYSRFSSRAHLRPAVRRLQHRVEVPLGRRPRRAEALEEPPAPIPAQDTGQHRAPARDQWPRSDTKAAPSGSLRHRSPLSDPATRAAAKPPPSGP